MNKLRKVKSHKRSEIPKPMKNILSAWLIKFKELENIHHLQFMSFIHFYKYKIYIFTQIGLPFTSDKLF